MALLKPLPTANKATSMKMPHAMAKPVRNVRIRFCLRAANISLKISNIDNSVFYANNTVSLFGYLLGMGDNNHSNTLVVRDFAQ